MQMFEFYTLQVYSPQHVVIVVKCSLLKVTVQCVDWTNTFKARCHWFSACYTLLNTQIAVGLSPCQCPEKRKILS